MSAYPQAMFDSPLGHLKQKTDKWGAAIAVPQTYKLVEVTSFGFSFGEGDVKTEHGRRQYAIHGGKGKSKIEPMAEVIEMTASALAMLLGVAPTAGSTLVYNDQTGTVIPDEFSSTIKIRQCATFHMGKFKAHTGLTINGATATATTADTIATGNFKRDGSSYQFSAADAGKTAVLSYDVAGGGGDVSVVSTFKIPTDLKYDIVLWQLLSDLDKAGVNGWFTKDTYSASRSAPATRHYQAASNGVLVFAAADAAINIVIRHTTDGVAATTTATVPAAGYYTIIDPPSSAVFATIHHVDLVSDSGTAMTGVDVGQRLTQSATPTSGQFDIDAGGIFTFAAADVGDVVTAYYDTDFEFVRVAPPNDGTFVEDLGVLNDQDLHLTRVALTSPVSLLPDQYAVDKTGAYYFDRANRGDRMRIDYTYAVDAGASLSIDNDPMGPTPEFEMFCSGTYEGQSWRVHYPRVAIKSIVPTPSQDGITKHKISLVALAPRGGLPVATVSMAA